eukprot:m.96446 g.96446  ORF g.96446 m.96446 type:complete len:554 (-) comp15491_c0_seq1:214-1875(-)
MATTATVLFSLPIRLWALTVVVLFLGTIALTYTLCIHEGACPKLPKLPTISGTWVTPPGNYISRTTVSIGCTMFFFGNIIMYWINQSRRSPSAKGPSNKTLLYMANIGVFCLSWVGAICDSKTPTCNGNGSVHSAFAVTFFILYDLYLYLLLHMKTRSIEDSPSLWMYLALGWSITSKLRFLPAVHAMLGDETPLAIFEWTDVACINALILRFMWPYTSYGVGVLQLADDSSENVDAKTATAPRKPKTAGKAFVLEAMSLTPAQAKAAEAMQVSMPVVTIPTTTTATVARHSGEEVRALTMWTADQWVGVVGTLAAFTLLGTWAVAVQDGAVPRHVLPEIGQTWVKAPGDWLARWGVMLTASCMTIMHVMTYQMRATLFGARAVAQRNYFGLLLQVVSILASFSLGLMGVVDEAENATLHRHAAMAFYGFSSFYMVGSTLDALCVGHSAGFRAFLMFLATAASLVAKCRFPTIAAHTHDALCGPHSHVSAPAFICDPLAARAAASSASDVPDLEWLDVLSIAVFTVATVYARPAIEGRKIVWSIFQKAEAWSY